MLYCCSNCGKIHRKGFKCKSTSTYQGGNERRLRSSWQWTQKSKEIREHAHYLCEVCKAEGRLIYDGVEVHHIVKVRDDESLLLDNYNLICLCTAHHRDADDGKIDIDYLKDIARKRENI